MARRQLPAACARSASFISTRTSFSASAKVMVDTSGRVGGAVPNAGGAPGVAGFACWPSNGGTAMAAKAVIDACVRNCRRDFDMNILRRDFLRADYRREAGGAVDGAPDCIQPRDSCAPRQKPLLETLNPVSRDPPIAGFGCYSAH